MGVLPYGLDAQLHEPVDFHCIGGFVVSQHYGFGRETADLDVSPLAEMKLAIYGAMLAQRISKAELARRLNCHMPQVDRLLNLAHVSRLDQIEAAFRAVGKRLVIAVEDAA